jgi:hypothetical protein
VIARHEGSFEANPPFIPAVIDRMASVIDRALASAAAADLALSFVVIVPSWSPEKAGACKGLEASRYLQRRSLSRNRRHDYCEGAQYKKRVGQYRRSTCDTAIYFLQTARAAKRWPASEDSCGSLLSALAGSSSVGTEIPIASAPLSSLDRIGADPSWKSPVEDVSIVYRKVAHQPLHSSRRSRRIAHGVAIGRRRLLGWGLLPPGAKLRHYRKHTRVRIVRSE